MKCKICGKMATRSNNKGEVYCEKHYWTDGADGNSVQEQAEKYETTRTRTAFLSIALLALFIASLPSLALSAPDGPLWFTDNFNSYNLGDIGGQGNWTEGNGTSGWIDVSDVDPIEGTKSLRAVGSGGYLSIKNYIDGTSGDPTYVQTGYICVSLSMSSLMLDSLDQAICVYINENENLRAYTCLCYPDVGIYYYDNQTAPGNTWIALSEDYSSGDEVNVCMEWDKNRSAGEQYRYALNGSWTDWTGGSASTGHISMVSTQFNSGDITAILKLDDFGTAELGPENVVNFTAPENESEQTTSFYITGTWSNVDPENYNEIDIFLGREDSFTMQFLCETAITTASGNFSCLVDENDWYQQDWIAQPLLTLKSCDEYGNCTYLNDKASNDPTLHITFAGDFSTSTIPALTIEGYTYETQWDSFAGFYASTSDRWSTSTNIGISLDNSIGAVLNWIFNLSSQLEVLDTDKELAGVSIGLAIQQGRGYLDTINNLFSGFPLGQIFSVYIIVFLLVLIIRLIKLARSLLPFI